VDDKDGNNVAPLAAQQPQPMAAAAEVQTSAPVVAAGSEIEPEPMAMPEDQMQAAIMHMLAAMAANPQNAFLNSIPEGEVVRAFDANPNEAQLVAKSYSQAVKESLKDIKYIGDGVMAGAKSDGSKRVVEGKFVEVRISKSRSKKHSGIKYILVNPRWNIPDELLQYMPQGDFPIQQQTDEVRETLVAIRERSRGLRLRPLPQTRRGLREQEADPTASRIEELD